MSSGTRSWTDTVAAIAGSAAEKARATAPETYDRAAQAANYLGESIRQYPIAGSVGGALLGYGLGFLLHHQWSHLGSARHINDEDGRSWTDTASNKAHSAAEIARPQAAATYDRAAQAKDYVSGSMTQYALAGSAVVALIGYALGLVTRRQSPRCRDTGDVIALLGMADGCARPRELGARGKFASLREEAAL